MLQLQKTPIGDRDADRGIERQQRQRYKMRFKFELDSDVQRQRCRRRSERFQTAATERGSIGRVAAVVFVVNEVAALSVGTQPDGVERPTEIGLVLGMSGDAAQLGATVGEATPQAVAARTALLELPAQFRLVALLAAAMLSITGLVY